MHPSDLGLNRYMCHLTGRVYTTFSDGLLSMLKDPSVFNLAPADRELKIQWFDSLKCALKTNNSPLKKVWIETILFPCARLIASVQEEWDSIKESGHGILSQKINNQHEYGMIVFLRKYFDMKKSTHTHLHAESLKRNGTSLSQVASTFRTTIYAESSFYDEILEHLDMYEQELHVATSTTGAVVNIEEAELDEL